MPDSGPNLILFFGHFHPLLVHLPIGFLAVLAVLELANRFHHFKLAAHARGVVLMLTVASSMAAVGCGLMLASGGGYDNQLLFWHKWMGIALSLACLLTALTFWGKRHRLYVGFLMIALLLLGPASHFGGSMTHGKDYLTEYAPNWMRSMMGNPDRPAMVKRKITDPKSAVVFTDLVQPVLQQSCISCHDADKLKGQLRLDSFDALKHGGATGPAIVAGSAKDSLMIQRIQLPLSDPHHMPPDGKPQPGDDQVALLRWWVDSGASSDKTAGELDPPVKINDVIASALGIPPVAPPPPPVPLDQLQPLIAQLAGKIGAVILPVQETQPWLACNAGVSPSFGDSQLAQLAPLAANITVLNLAGTKVTDAGLAALEQMSHLQRLRLERTAITDAGLKHLVRLRNLDYLNLYKTSISDAGLKTLTGLPSLHHLYLWRTRVTPDAARAFADAMVDQTRIQRLQQQIASLQAQINGQTIEVQQGIPSPATAPTTAPVASTH